jgi:hypothetical protein
MDSSAQGKVEEVTEQILRKLSKASLTHAREVFGRELAEQVATALDANALVCCVRWQMDGTGREQCTGWKIAVTVHCLDILMHELTYDLIVVPRTSKPIVFKRLGDGGDINWAVWAEHERGNGDKEHLIYLPSYDACKRCGVE